MTRALFKAYSAISISAIAAIVVAITAGTLRSQPAALSGFDDCQLPCWNLITPEQTSQDRANNLLGRVGYKIESVNHHWRYMTFRPDDPAACRAALTYDTTIFLTELIECTDVSLGDVMAILGPPQGIIPSILFDSFIYRDGTVAVIARRPRCESGFSLYTEVSAIRLRARLEVPVETEPVSTVNPLPWRGLMLLWKYDDRQRDC